MIAALAVLAASLAAAADTAPPPAAPLASSAAAPAPVAAPSVALLKERFLAATDDASRQSALDELSRTTPVSGRDVSALFDLFSRFSEPALRRKVMDSLARLQPDNPQLEPLFITYLQQSEPESRLFGVNGAFRLRSREALPLVRKIASKKLSRSSASAVNALSERNEYWTQYEALSALAQWEPERTLKLLREKAQQSPAMARLLGQHYWRTVFPDLRKWAVSSDLDDRERAVEASGAPISPADARATRDGMLALVRDANADDEVRHRLALKVGACSSDEEVDALTSEHDRAKDDKTRLLLAAAVFAAHSPRSVPLLARYAKDAPDDQMRAGARVELVELVGEDQAKRLLGRAP